MTDKRLSGKLAKGGQRKRQEQEDATGESSKWTVEDGSGHLHMPQGGTETDQQSQETWRLQHPDRALS